MEVDRDRGRIGLTLVAKVQDDGTELSPEQLVEVAEANPAPPRAEGDRPRRDGGGGGGPRPRPAGATAKRAPTHIGYQCPALPSPERGRVGHGALH